jgi:hypothetical protein
VGIGVIVIALLGIAGWKLSSNAASQDWQFYVSVHYGDSSLSNEETKTMVVDGQQSNDSWSVFRLTSLCDFSGPTADLEQYMIVMSEQPEVLQMEHPTSDVVLVKLQEPLHGAGLTDFSNFMLRGVAETGLNNCGSTA